MSSVNSVNNDYRELREFCKQADEQFARMSEVLDRMLLRATVAASVRNPGKTVVGCSAQGEWSMRVVGSEVYPPVLGRFDHIRKEYGLGPIPHVRHTVIDGKVTSEYNW